MWYHMMLVIIFEQIFLFYLRNIPYKTCKKRPKTWKIVWCPKFIKPALVEAVSAFRALGNFASKFRNCCNDDAFNTLMFLREDYNK